MISWIQRNLQHHFRLVFALVLIGTIVSLIIAFNPSSGFGRDSDRHVLKRSFFGYNLGSQTDSERLFGDANLSIQLLHIPVQSDSQAEAYAFQRAAAVAMADRLHIPAPSAEALETFIKKLPAFADAKGEFDVERYEAFRSGLGARLTAADVTRVLTDDWRAEQAGKLIGGPGYVLPGDVKNLLVQADTRWTLDIATVNYADYVPTLSFNRADIEKFFAANSFRYQIPARIRVSCVKFPIESFLDQVRPTAEEVRAYYDANPSKFARPTPDKKTAAAKPGTAADFAAVRPQVELVLRLERARNLAAQAAADFAVDLYNQKITGWSPAFDAAVRAHHLTVKALAPFTADNPPAELGSSPDVSEQAFRLGPDRFVSDSLDTPSGSVVLFYNETLPAHTPLLSEVEKQVVADYREIQKRDRFFDLAKTIHNELATRLKTGASFDTAAAAIGAANGLKLTVQKPAPFTLRQPPHDLDETILGNIDHLTPHAVADMVFADNKGYFVYLADKKLPSTLASDPQYALTRDRLAAYNAREAVSDQLQEIVTNELKKSAPAESP